MPAQLEGSHVSALKMLCVLRSGLRRQRFGRARADHPSGSLASVNAWMIALSGAGDNLPPGHSTAASPFVSINRCDGEGCGRQAAASPDNSETSTDLRQYNTAARAAPNLPLKSLRLGIASFASTLPLQGAATRIAPRTCGCALHSVLTSNGFPLARASPVVGNTTTKARNPAPNTPAAGESSRSPSLRSANAPIAQNFR